MYGQNENESFRKIVTVLLIVIFAFGFSCRWSERSADTEPEPPANQARTEPPPASSSSGPVLSYADVVKRVSPAVVTVQSQRRVRAPRQFPFLNDPRSREFFGERFGRQAPQEPRPQIERGLGSGVVVSTDGYILTNHHVIDGADQIKVGMRDRQTFDARVIGSDPPSDLAVLKIEATNLPSLSLGDSDAVQVGDIVLAIGDPLGLEQTVTAGIISAKGRSTGVSDGTFEDFLQTDAPINRGNSGGALVNTAGELIGINSQIVSSSGGNIGIGFAIPSNMSKNVMDQLIKTGTVRRGQLGVAVQPVSSDIARSLNMPEPRGVIVADVQPQSAAARAGLRTGDIIVSINGDTVNEANKLRNRVASTPPGTEIALTILRDGGEQEVRVTLGELEAAGPRADR